VLAEYADRFNKFAHHLPSFPLRSGATGVGNPVGGLVFSNGVQMHEWFSFSESQSRERGDCILSTKS